MVTASWNEAAFGVLGGADGPAECVEFAAVERWLRGPLPAAVREWFVLGGDRRLAAVSANLLTLAGDLTGRTAGRFLDHGYLLLETDSQRCCRWVVPITTVADDPPVYLVDPDDDACVTRIRYAGSFSDHTYTAAWDATLWRGEVSADFDHPLLPDALKVLRRRLTALPATHGWALSPVTGTPVPTPSTTPPSVPRSARSAAAAAAVAVAVAVVASFPRGRTAGRVTTSRPPGCSATSCSYT